MNAPASSIVPITGSLARQMSTHLHESRQLAPPREWNGLACCSASDAQGSPESVFSCFFLSELFICAEGGPGFFLSVKRLLQNVLPDLANHELETWGGNALSNISVH